MDSPKHLSLFEYIPDHEFLIGIDDQHHPLRMGPVGENKRNVGGRWWSKFDGVNVLAHQASHLEIGSISNFFLSENIVGGHLIARWTIRGIVEDFFLFIPVISFVHGLPSFFALNPLGLNPPTWMVCKA
tara:strand:+ start:8817 stop:9203 length:387 start_codon:yes stop_codon:yes gene_type:complete